MLVGEGLAGILARQEEIPRGHGGLFRGGQLPPATPALPLLQQLAKRISGDEIPGEFELHFGPASAGT